MPDFIIEVVTRNTYGPFTYVTAARLREDLVAGKLDMTEFEFETNAPTSLKVKEVKPEK